MPRLTNRPPVQCFGCNALLYWLDAYPHPTGPNVIQVHSPEPPSVTVACPRCNQPVDTTLAYPVLPGYPPSFTQLRAAWAGFKPEFEFNRESPEDQLRTIDRLKLPAELNSGEGPTWLKQRMAYRSTLCFYRAFTLFLAALTLQRRSYRTWADVTAYYSRFYSIQAILNLFLTSFFRDPSEILIYHNGSDAVVLEKRNWPKTIRAAGTHDRWWYLMETLKLPSDYPGKHLDFILSRAYYNPDQRNTINYDFTYIWGGFPELDWCDTDAPNMMAHYRPSPRPDKDITDKERFYENADPEYVDGSEFAADEIQAVWLSIPTYLELLNGLEIAQTFITMDKLAALLELHLLPDYPKITRGILIELAKLLDVNYDVAGKVEAMLNAEHYTFFSRSRQS